MVEISRWLVGEQDGDEVWELGGRLYRAEEAYSPGLGTTMLIWPADASASRGVMKAA